VRSESLGSTMEADSDSIVAGRALKAVARVQIPSGLPTADQAVSSGRRPGLSCVACIRGMTDSGATPIGNPSVCEWPDPSIAERNRDSRFGSIMSVSFHGRLTLTLAESGDLIIIPKFMPNAIRR